MRQLTAAMYELRSDLREEILHDNAARVDASNEALKAEMRVELDALHREVTSNIAAAAADRRARDREIRRLRHILDGARVQPSDAASQVPPSTPAMFPSDLDVESYSITPALKICSVETKPLFVHGSRNT